MQTNIFWRIKYLFLFIYMVGPGINSFAQTEGIVNEVMKLCDNQIGGGEAVCGQRSVTANLNTMCNAGNIDLAVFCADLVPFPDGNTTYDWPEDRYPVYIKYEHSPGQFQIIGPFIDWEYTGFTNNGHNIFQSAFTVQPVDLITVDCSDPPSDGYYVFNMGIALMTEYSPGTPLKPYPVHLYGQPNDIFTCEVFLQNCHICNPYGIDCPIGGLEPEDILKVCIDCESCGTVNDDPELRIASSSSKVDNQLKVSPNPFSSFINYDFYSPTDTQIIIRLFTVEGRELLREVKKVGVGSNKFLLDTQYLSQGVYYFKVGDSKNSIRRLIKME